MYVAQMEPELLNSLGCWGRFMSDFQVVRQMVRQKNETV